MRTLLTALFMVLIAPAATAPAHADTPAELTKLDEAVERAITRFDTTVKDGKKWRNLAEATLVFPGVIEGAVIVGSEYGKGALVIDGVPVDYYTFTSGSVGAQIGVQKKDVYIMFFDEDALNELRADAGGWVVGANASAALFDEGGTLTADTSNLDDPIVVAVLNQSGLLAGVDFRGARIGKLDR